MVGRRYVYKCVFRLLTRVDRVSYLALYVHIQPLHSFYQRILQLYLTDPAGIYSEWKAYALGGRNEKAVNEYLEKNWTAGMTEEDSVRATIKALLEVVDSGAKNMEIAVMRRGEAVKYVLVERRV